MKKIVSAILALSMILALGSVQAQSKTSHKKKAATVAVANKKDHHKEAKKAVKKTALNASSKTVSKAEKARTISTQQAEKHGKKSATHAKNEKTARATLAKANNSRSHASKSSMAANGKAVHTGPRGGKYYINKNGNKTYLGKGKK